MAITKNEIRELSFAERNRILSLIREVNSEEAYTDHAGKETEQEKNMLREELQDYRRNPSSAKTWEEVMLDMQKSING